MLLGTGVSGDLAPAVNDEDEREADAAEQREWSVHEDSLKIKKWMDDADASGLADPGRRDRRAEAGAVAEIDVQSSQRFEVARVLQRASIDRRETDTFDQRLRGLLRTDRQSVVPGQSVAVRVDLG